MIKWIGGTTAAIALLFGGATVAAGLLDGETPPAIKAAPVLTMEEAIPAENAGSGAADSPQPEMVSNPVVQPIPEPKPEQAAKPKKKDERFVIKRILPIDGPIKYGEWHWDEEGVPDGPLVMTVDLDARVISVFRGGYEIGAAAVLLGTQDHPTPLGTFPILQKKRHNISSIYGAPMPYTMRLTWDGISIHGSQVENGFASHGCIGTPEEFAAKVFAVAGKGDKVIITRGETMKMGDAIL